MSVSANLVFLYIKSQKHSPKLLAVNFDFLCYTFLFFRGMNMTSDEFEYLLGQSGAIPTEIKSDPTPKVKDVMMSSLRQNCDDSSDNDDW